MASHGDWKPFQKSDIHVDASARIWRNDGGHYNTEGRSSERVESGNSRE